MVSQVVKKEDDPEYFINLSWCDSLLGKLISQGRSSTGFTSFPWRQFCFPSSSKVTHSGHIGSIAHIQMWSEIWVIAHSALASERVLKFFHFYFSKMQKNLTLNCFLAVSIQYIFKSWILTSEKSCTSYPNPGGGGEFGQCRKECIFFSQENVPKDPLWRYVITIIQSLILIFKMIIITWESSSVKV